MQQNLKYNIKSRLGKDELTLFDVGAKGGAFMFPKLKAFVRSYGFEPNEEEFAKLKEDEEQIYFPYALSENGGKALLNQYKIGIIFCEVSFVQSYKNQNLFSELDLYLRAQDYEFIDCRYYPDGVGKNQNIFSKKSNLPDSEIDSILKYFNEKSPQDIIRNWIPPILYQFLRQLRLKFKA